jgi:hypothetical protein
VRNDKLLTILRVRGVLIVVLFLSHHAGCGRFIQGRSQVTYWWATSITLRNRRTCRHLTCLVLLAVVRTTGLTISSGTHVGRHIESDFGLRSVDGKSDVRSGSLLVAVGSQVSNGEKRLVNSVMLSLSGLWRDVY